MKVDTPWRMRVTLHRSRERRAHNRRALGAERRAPYNVIEMRVAVALALAVAGCGGARDAAGGGALDGAPFDEEQAPSRADLDPAPSDPACHFRPCDVKAMPRYNCQAPHGGLLEDPVCGHGCVLCLGAPSVCSTVLGAHHVTCVPWCGFCR
jgi:hypothetical protein